MSPQNYLKSEYNSNSPYGDSYYARSAGYIPPQTPRKPISKWIKFGIPAAILIVAAIAVGVAVGVTRHSSSQQSADAAASSASQASASASSQSDLGLFVTSYGSQYLNPYYPSVVSLLRFSLSFSSLHVYPRLIRLNSQHRPSMPIASPGQRIHSLPPTPTPPQSAPIDLAS